MSDIALVPLILTTVELEVIGHLCRGDFTTPAQRLNLLKSLAVQISAHQSAREERGMGRLTIRKQT